MSKTEKQTKVASKSAGDLAHVAVKAALSAIPGAGGPLTELFAYLVTDPVTQRRDAWIEEIAQRLQDLQARLNRPLIEELKHDETFTTVLLNASQIAVRNHQQEKIEALANAVLNAALGMTPDETERAIMLSLIDRLTPTHVAVLRLFQAPGTNSSVAQRMAGISMGGLSHVIGVAFPELAARKELVQLVWRDLADAGLLLEGGLNVTMSGSGLLQKRTTAFGDAFLRFVSAPSL